jgi:hypothetical protein
MVTIFVAGCMVGPKYVKPNTPLASEFKEQPPESFKEGYGNDSVQNGPFAEYNGSGHLQGSRLETSPSAVTRPRTANGTLV